MFEIGCLFLDKSRFEKGGFHKTRIRSGSDMPGLSQLTSVCILFCDVPLFSFLFLCGWKQCDLVSQFICMLVCSAKTLDQLFRDLSVCLVVFVVVVLCFC